MHILTSETPELCCPVPLIVVGAFDRHNFGDLLFAHIAAALLPDEHILFAGLHARDMRAYGGHAVRSLAQMAQAVGHAPVRVLHAGGELLSCGAWEAAVMLHSRPEAEQIIGRYGKDARARERWAHAFLGIPDHAPYTVARTLFPGMRTLVYSAVGGADFSFRPAALRNEVLNKLAEADDVSVRDRQTLASLRAHGVCARLMPDPAVMSAELFGPAIDRHAGHGEPAQMRADFPQGYLAVQFDAGFDSPSVLGALAAQLARVASASRCGIVLFRAGAAPWHDDLDLYRRLAAQLPAATVRIFHSLDVWDICAVIAGSRGYCGGSLHGRILAMATARPRLNVRHPEQPPAMLSKQEAFAQTWEDPGLPGVAALEDLEEKLLLALAADSVRLEHTARRLAQAYRGGFEILKQKLANGRSDQSARTGKP